MQQNLRLLLLCFLLLGQNVTNAQQIQLDKYFKNYKPRCIGPSGMSGRITAIDALWDKPNTIYIGAASGGVWKTENGGTGWTPIFDDQPTQNIGSLAIQQTNPSVIWVGTGEGNPRNSINIGEGIYKTLDGGKTWKRMGLENTRNIHRIIIDPVNPNIVYAGAIGNPYGIHPERGLFKTTDGGETWSKILYTNDTSGVADMIMDPKNPNKLMVALWQHQRTPWSFKGGGKGSGLYMTFDGGKSWKKLGKEEGLPDGDYGRIGITACYDMPNRIYALVEATKNGLYKSDDGGLKWQLVNSEATVVTNRPFYFQDIICDPQNENRLWMINQTVTMSEDGGKTFTTVIPYNGIHPDHHAFWIHPKNPSYIIDGNDGGIGITRDKGKTWQFDEKIPVGQFYHINTDNEIPYNVMGGMQDNGSWRGPAYTWTRAGIKNYYWESLWGGDGFDVLPDPDDATWVYAMSQEGNVGRYNVNTGESWNIRPPSVAAGAPGTRLRFNWNAAIAQDPFDHNTIYYGSQYVHKSTNKGASWTTISNDLTTNDSAKMDQRNNGGISIDITGAENHCTILVIEPSAKQQGVIWAGTDDGNVQLTKDGGKTWTSFRGKIPGMPVGSWIPQIKASRYNAGEAFVVCNDYRRGDFKPYIFRTTNFGATWTRMVDETKVKGYALCIIQDPTEPNLIFAGTENGLWVSFDNGNTFQQYKNGYPSVSTYDLAIQEREADLCIATFGRAIWILDDIRLFRKIAAEKGNLAKNITINSVNDAYQATVKNAPGYEWSTWGIWDAENRNRGAGVTYYVKKLAPRRDTVAARPADAAPATQPEIVMGPRAGGGGRRGGGGLGAIRGDTALVRIYNDKNELVRTLRWGVDSGYNRNYWGLEEKGVRQPGTPKPRPGASEPGGAPVLPGRYKMVFTYNRETDSTFVNVQPDPRSKVDYEARKAQKQMLTRLYKGSDQLNEGLDRLTEAEEVAKKIDAQLTGVEGKDADSVRRISKKVQDDIKTLREFVSGKRSERQGYGEVPQVTVITTINEARTVITGKPTTPGTQEEILVQKAEEKIKESITRINGFFAGRWTDFRNLHEATKVNLFKEYKPL
jgi:photosystem II stability/assembly factor-like uncharacterized protein